MNEEKKVYDPKTIIKEVDDGTSLGITQTEIETFLLKKDQMAQLKKDVDPISEKIKIAMLSNGVKKAKFGNVTLEVSFQNKATMDEDKLVALLKEKQLDDAIMTFEKPNPDKIVQLMKDGLLTDDDIQLCMVPNFVAVLKSKKPKKDEPVNHTLLDAIDESKTKRF